MRVKDICFETFQIMVRDGKGMQDRVTMLPRRVLETLKAHLANVRSIHQCDLATGFGSVYLPTALAKKYPNAAREFCWQYVFHPIAFPAIHAAERVVVTTMSGHSQATCGRP